MKGPSVDSGLKILRRTLRSRSPKRTSIGYSQGSKGQLPQGITPNPRYKTMNKNLLQFNMSPSHQAQAYLGIDWASQKHDWCLRGADGKILGHGVIDNSPQVITALINACLRTIGSHGKLNVGLESSNNPIARQLRENESIVFFVIHPGTFATYRETKRKSKAKDDTSDAALISDYLRRHGDELTPCIEHESPLNLLCRYRRKEVDNRTASENILTADLKQVFPEVLEIFDDIAHPGLQALLLAFPTMQEAKAAGMPAIIAAIGKHCRKATFDKLETALSQAQPFFTNKRIIAVIRCNILAQVAKIQAANQIIETLEDEAHALAIKSKKYSILDTLPAAGKVFCPRLIAIFDALPDGVDPETVLILNGIAPVTISSGNFRTVKMRHSGKGFSCQTLFEYAAMTKLHCGWAAEIFQKHKKRFGTAARKVAEKWVRIICAMLKTNTPYNEEAWLASRKLQPT